MIFRHGRRTGDLFYSTVRALLASGLLLSAIHGMAADNSVSLAWDPSPDATVTGYKIYYGPVSRGYTQQVSVGNVTNATISGLITGASYYITATAYDDTGLESDFCNEVFYQVPGATLNQSPTLDPIANISLVQNSAGTDVQLTGIGAGEGESGQSVSISASSSNPAIVPAPLVSYFAPNTWASLAVAPAAGATGTATITVTVNDGQAVNNVVQRSFVVTVSAIPNAPPTLDLPPNISLQENAGMQTVLLSGISSGSPTESQPLSLTAASSNSQLIPQPTILYSSPSATGTLQLTPVANAFGSTVISVTVSDGQSSVTRAFSVTVSPVNQPPTLNPINSLAVNVNGGQQTVTLTGISSGAANEADRLSVTAFSSNPSVVPHPVVTYASPATTGTLTFTPVEGASGSATISVAVNDGQPTDNLITRSFVVTVSASAGNQPPTLDPISDMTVADSSGVQSVQLTGISSGSPSESQRLLVTAVSSNPGIIPNPNVSYTSPNASGSLWFTPVAGASGSVMLTVTVYDDQEVNNSVTRKFMVTVIAPNRAPTFDQIGNVTLPENSKDYPVTLTGISPGSAQENQQVTFSASSSNPALMPPPTVSYTSPDTTATLTMTPVAYASGTAVITVTANDGQATNNLFSRVFIVRVEAVNQAPTLNALPDLTLTQNASMQSVPLAGISSGAPNENQTLLVTATSSDPSVIPNPQVSYASPGSTGTLSFTPVRDAKGTAVISVTVSDGGPDNNTTVRTFVVSVKTDAQALVEKIVSGSGTALLVHGRAGASYQVEYSTDGTHWTPVSRVAATEADMTVPLPGGAGPGSYRALEFNADPPVVEAHLRLEEGRTLLIYGLPNAQYTIECSTNLGPERVWYPLSSSELTDSFLYQKVPDLGGYSLFRVRKN